MKNYIEKIYRSRDYILSKIKRTPSIAIVLGSGLDDLVDVLEDVIEIKYREIPDFPVTTVKGHSGVLVSGYLNGKCIVFLRGRFHYYEGYNMDEVTFYIRVIKSLGTENIVLTNSAGGINGSFRPGDLMLIRDHISLFMPESPLRGENLEMFGPRFPDMLNCYSKKLRTLTENIAQNLKIKLREGSYSYVMGPMYETGMEVKLLKQLCIDAVGMSTVPEAIVAKHCGMNILGISCITNMAAGIGNESLNHEDVIIKAKESLKDLRKLLINVLINWNC